MHNKTRHYCFTCKAITYHLPGSNKHILACTGCHTAKHFCSGCDAELEAKEVEHSICDGCAIDSYETTQRIREQRYLENDANWPE